MLFRFCLYGFLKNQRYFEPFLILAFRQKGLDFAVIGLLIGFREVCINLMEIPTGAVADVLGRRKAMIFSHLGYIAAFVIFALSEQVWPLFAAMFVYAIGDAFRTGTHKAMIFAWLKHEGREDQKTKTYGYTRSWSKLGSAVAVLAGATVVFCVQDYVVIFWISIIPAALNIINFLTYPRYLDGLRAEKLRGGILRTLTASLRDCLHLKPIRRLLAESMGFEGIYKVSHDYLQPVLKATALSLPVMLSLSGSRRTAVLVGAVYFVLYLLSSLASRHSDAFSRFAGGDDRGARRLWVLNTACFALLAAGLWIGINWLAITIFVALAILQNFWRPMLVSRIAHHAHPDRMATILSTESQAKTLFAAVAAPIVGWSVDLMPTDAKFLPVAALGLLVSLAMLATARTANK